MAENPLERQFSKVKQAAIDAITSIFPVEKQKHKIVLNKVWVKDDLDVSDFKGQLRSKARDGTWGVPVQADLSLIDLATKKTIDRHQSITLFTLPKLTTRGSYIVKGNEYQVANQLRLKSGAYTKKTKDGTVKSQFNLARGGSSKLELHINDKNIVQMQAGTSKIPLFPLLIGMGISDAQIRKSWGDTLYGQNADSTVSPLKAIQKLSSTMTGSTTANTETAKEELQAFIRDKTEINPTMTKLTVGAAHSNFSPLLWLDASKKLLDVAKGDADIDDVDNLAYKDFIGIEDSIKERLEKNKATLVRKIQRNLDSRNTIKEIVSLGTFGNLIDSFFTEDERSAPSEQINPLHMISSADKITFMGPGSISSVQQVTEDMRNVHPTHLSYIDPIATPEGEKIGLRLSMSIGAEKRDRDIVSPFWDVKGKKFVKMSPLEVYDKRVAFPDEWDAKTKSFNKMIVKIKYKGKHDTAPVSDVDYVMPFAQNAFSMSTNLVPFLASNNGNRVMMASKQLEQAVALKHREAPMIQTQMAKGVKQTFEQNVGSAFSVYATEGGAANGTKISGKVHRITKDGVEIKDGRKIHKIPLYENFPLNQKTFMHNDLKVAVGDTIKPGQILADSNYTKDGVLALGTSLKTAYIPYKGYNFEDGIVITDSAAVKLTSEHMHKKQVSLRDNIVLSKSKFVANFPNNISSDNRSKLDEDGVMTKGARVNPGDIIIAAMKDAGAYVGAELIKSKLAKGLGKKFRDIAETWTMDMPGIVTDVNKSASKVTVYIKTEEPAKIGDKLCYDDKTEVFTDRGWLPFCKVTLDDKIATLSPDSNTLEFRHPTYLYTWDHHDSLISIQSPDIDLCVTDNHSLYAQLPGEPFRLIEAKDLLDKSFMVQKHAESKGGHLAQYPGIINIISEDWLKILAISLVAAQFKTKHVLTYYDFPHLPELLALFDKYHITWKESSGVYEVYNLDLYENVRIVQGGLPREITRWNKTSAKCFIDFLLPVCGSDRIYSTGRKRNADQVHQLAINAGYCADLLETGSSYLVVIRDPYFPEVRSEHIKKIDYRGKVYCCTVPNHILMVRRNGKTVWCGNSGRHGNKGIITKVIPDSEAPHTADGKPVDIMLNPHGIISRINIGQLYESALGKISTKTKKGYNIANFSGDNYLDTVKGEMKKHKVDDLEELTDPTTGKSLGQVHVGNPYILKLNKQSEVNFSVRGEHGPVQTGTMQPKGGGPEGAKGIDALTMYSLLSHGARANLKEMSTLKSENNPELWENLKYGRTLPAPKVPFVFERLKNMLKASGVDVRKDGSNMQLLPLTDKQTKQMSSMEIQTPLFVRASGGDISETRGGFVDGTRLGGLTGDKWAHIALKEAAPNPLFEDAIKTVTGMVGKDYNAILKGEKEVDVAGKKLTGSKAITALLDSINVKSELQDLKRKMPGLKENALNKAIKKYRLLDALDKNDLTPSGAYTRKLIPVIPPKFRPISMMEDGNIAADDTNFLYRNVALLNQQLKLPVTDLLDDQDLSAAKGELYKNMKGLSGLESIKFSGKDKIGFIETIAGTKQPKEGFFQNKVLKKQQVLTGRGTIIPEPKLHMDEVGLPEKMAWTLYKPFVIKNLIRKGHSAKSATNEVSNTSISARKALDEAMQDRPLLLNRAPSLHKFSILAFKPKITDGLAIKIPPLVTNSFNADFDGDTMTAHVPVTDAAVRESYGMFPSRNLYKPGTGNLIVGPSQESLLGFYLLTKTIPGRLELNNLLPKGFTITKELNKKESTRLFNDISKKMSNEDFSVLIDKIKVLGETHAYNTGFSVGIKDLDIIKDRDKYVRKVEVEAAKYKKGQHGIFDFLSKYIGIKKGMEADMDTHYKGKNNSLYEMVNSGARGNKDQLMQILASPLVVNDVSGKPVPLPIKKSFTEGLSFSDYWTASYGARKGMIDRSIETSEPGMLNKALISATIDNVVSMEDCGTTEGISIASNNPTILGRLTQGINGSVPRNTTVSSDLISRLPKMVFVRSPLKCRAPRGTCRKCYGSDENGKLVSIGDNIGVKAAQTIAEPLSQGVMNTFHTGGVTGRTGVKSGLPRIKELLTMPKSIRKGKAVLAKLSGKITKIEPSGLKGFIIWIGTVKHVTSTGQGILVRMGQSVEAGDKLTEGAVSPQELLTHKGMPAVQKYLTTELEAAYKDQGMDVDKKTFETIVRSLTNRTLVTNDAIGSSWLPGETVSMHTVEDYNKKRKKDEEAVTHMPYIKGINQLPGTRQDWLSQMGAKYLKNAIVNGASQGWGSDVKGYHPIPAYAYGAEFGEGEDGKY